VVRLRDKKDKTRAVTSDQLEFRAGIDHDVFIGDHGTHVVLLDRISNLHIPHLLPSDRIFLLGVRLGLSLAVLQPFQFLIRPSTCDRNLLAVAISYRSAVRM
jgi:hypothetical protein